MNLRRIKHMLLRLSPEEKLAGAGAIIVLVSAFLPWFSIVFSSTEKASTVSGFSGDLGVIGFVVFLLTGMATAFLIADHLNLKIPNFGFKKEQVTLFLMGESAFLLLLTIAVYTKRSFEYTNAEIRFGLYAALIGAFAGAFAAFSETQKNNKKVTEAFFNHEEEAVAKTVEVAEVESVTTEAEYQEQDYMPEKKEAELEPVTTEQKSFFYEESADNAEELPDNVAEGEDANPSTEEGNITEVEDTNPRTEEVPTEPEAPSEPEPEPVVEPEPEPEEIPAEPKTPVEEEPAEPEPVAEPEPEIPEEEEAPEATPEETPPISSGMDQGDFLVREATGKVKVDMDSVKKVEKKSTAVKNNEPVETETMSFYDDL